jgi:hypothetical protein
MNVTAGSPYLQAVCAIIGNPACRFWIIIGKITMVESENNFLDLIWFKSNLTEPFEFYICGRLRRLCSGWT